MRIFITFNKIIYNLISNACKFTESGKVTLSTAYLSDSKDFFEIAVKDTGIGMTNEQVKDCVGAIKPDVPCYISVFAGRIADTGIDPIPMMTEALEIMSVNKSLELIWASPRELLNIIQANDIGCHVITVTNDIFKKLKIIGYNLDDYSLDTVKMFYDDAKKAGYTL